jgi:hypothetical protein
MHLHWDSPTIQILFAVLLAVLPLTITEIPVMWKCALWVVALVIVFHLVHDSFPGISRLPLTICICLGVGTTAFLVAASYNPIMGMWIEEKASALKGELSPIGDGRDHSHELPILQFGPTGGALPPWSGPPDTPMIKAYYDSILIKRIDGVLKLTTTVRDDNKNIIVDVDRNVWTINPDKSVSWDHNYTKDSLEVLDGKKRVVFQVKILPNRVQLQQEWQWDKGTPSGGIFEDGKYSEKEGIKPAFLYPSREFWGQLNKEPY